MSHTTRSQFLTALGAAAVPLAAVPAILTRDDREHAFIASPQSDFGEEPLWHGYPDECFAMTSFADSLVALAWGAGWYVQPPMVALRNAIMVDFASLTEDEAEASIARGWNGAYQFRMGVVNTVASRTETNAQNARFERQLTLIGTAVRQAEFQKAVIENLLGTGIPQCHPYGTLNRYLL